MAPTMVEASAGSSFGTVGADWDTETAPEFSQASSLCSVPATPPAFTAIPRSAFACALALISSIRSRAACTGHGPTVSAWQ